MIDIVELKKEIAWHEEENNRLRAEVQWHEEENNRLREALRRIQRPEAEMIDGVIKWIKEDAERLAFARSALEEKE